MKLKKPLLCTAVAAINVLSLGAALVLGLAGSSAARSQSWNRSAQKWDRDGESRQISCYFSEDSGFTTDGMYALRSVIQDALRSSAARPDGSIPETPDAYSTPIGSGNVTCDSTGRSAAELTAVGGDFFFFRDFRLLSGAYFSDSDIMQDGAVIERSLAWTLYGSPNIAGQLIYIDGVQFYISGVIDDPTDKYEKRTAGEAPRVYISYSGAASLPQVSGMTDGDMNTAHKLTKITSYECIMYDPVKNFAYNTVNDYFKDTYKGSYHAVNNTERFSPTMLAKAYKKRSDLAVRKDTVTFPYWENASRIVEFRLAPLYFWRTACFVIPILTALTLIWIGFRFLRKHSRSLISALIEKHKKAAYDRKQRKANI